ncbi:hypothetical protein Tco_0615433 [Tanacetum coccineum]
MAFYLMILAISFPSALLLSGVSIGGGSWDVAPFCGYLFGGQCQWRVLDVHRSPTPLTAVAVVATATLVIGLSPGLFLRLLDSIWRVLPWQARRCSRFHVSLSEDLLRRACSSAALALTVFLGVRTWRTFHSGSVVVQAAVDIRPPAYHGDAPLNQGLLVSNGWGVAAGGHSPLAPYEESGVVKVAQLVDLLSCDCHYRRLAEGLSPGTVFPSHAVEDRPYHVWALALLAGILEI